jgi:hypothetical protein
LTETGAFGANDVGNVASVLYVGNIPTNTLFGHIDEFRISKGIARWTADFTPPLTAYGSEVFMTTNKGWL